MTFSRMSGNLSLFDSEGVAQGYQRGLHDLGENGSGRIGHLRGLFPVINHDMSGLGVGAAVRASVGRFCLSPAPYPFPVQGNKPVPKLPVRLLALSAIEAGNMTLSGFACLGDLRLRHPGFEKCLND